MAFRAERPSTQYPVDQMPIKGNCHFASSWLPDAKSRFEMQWARERFLQKSASTLPWPDVASYHPYHDDIHPIKDDDNFWTIPAELSFFWRSKSRALPKLKQGLGSTAWNEILCHGIQSQGGKLLSSLHFTPSFEPGAHSLVVGQPVGMMW